MRELATSTKTFRRMVSNQIQLCILEDLEEAIAINCAVCKGTCVRTRLFETWQGTNRGMVVLWSLPWSVDVLPYWMIWRPKYHNWTFSTTWPWFVLLEVNIVWIERLQSLSSSKKRSLLTSQPTTLCWMFVAELAIWQRPKSWQRRCGRSAWWTVLRTTRSSRVFLMLETWKPPENSSKRWPKQVFLPMMCPTIV